MDNQATKNRIKMSVGAIIGVIIGISIGYGLEGSVLDTLIGAWVGLGIGGNIMPFFSEIGYKFSHGFAVGAAKGDSFKDNIITTVIYIAFAVVWRLIKDAVWGPIRFGFQMFLGEWDRFIAKEE